ncbi:MAG: hypothetical protein ACP5NS_04350 [Candidatus Pacearchaeota archaeon]
MKIGFIIGLFALIIIGISLYLGFNYEQSNNFVDSTQVLEQNENILSETVPLNLPNTVAEVHLMDELESTVTDDFNVESLIYEDSTRTLTATIIYLGKCVPHIFELYVSSNESKYIILHNANGDTCTDKIWERVSFVIPSNITFFSNSESGIIVEQSFDS